MDALKFDLMKMIETDTSQNSILDENYRNAVITHFYRTTTKPAKITKDTAISIARDELLSKPGAKARVSSASVMDEIPLLFPQLIQDVPFPPVEDPTFTFIDLFAGIGGFRLAMQDLGGECVFSSEWDKSAQKTYFTNFGEVPFGDITDRRIKNHVPDNFDILCAGFPCQAFSIAGRRGGFEDTRGTLFFHVAEIIKEKRPKAVFLENVKGLKSHNRGKTLDTILNVLDELEYDVVPHKIINAKDFGVAQNRERIFIVAFDRNLKNLRPFEYPAPTSKEGQVKFSKHMETKKVSAKYYLSKRYLDTLVKHRARHEAKGNGFGYEIIDKNGIANAIVVGGMGRERNLVVDFRQDDLTPVTNIKGEINTDGIRKMTPREWANLQGFPKKFKIPVADASAYKQFGNSVAVPAIRATAKQILQSLGKI